LGSRLGASPGGRSGRCLGFHFLVKDCHAGPTSEIIGWPYFALGLTFVIPALIARRRGKSIWVSIGQGALSLVLAVFLFLVMYGVYLSVYSVDLGGCLG
jgi:hypothetical protein